MKGYLGAFQNISEAKGCQKHQKGGGEGFSNRPKMKLKSKLNGLMKRKEVAL